jgi:Tol biopolymer transport system component
MLIRNLCKQDGAGRGILGALGVLLAALLFLLAGCSSDGNDDPFRQDNPQPNSALSGYYSANQMVTGGVAAEGVNVKSVSAERSGDETVVTISFIYGSKYSDVDEAKMDAVPQYRAYGTETPSRFVLELGNIEFWDWEKQADEGFAEDPFHGLFYKIPYESSPYTLFFQMTAGMAFQIQEKEDTLVIRLAEEVRHTKPSHYVMLDAYYEYQEGKVMSDWGFLPSYTEDLSSRVLLSGPMESEAKAQEFLQQASTDMRDTIAGDKFSVVSIVGDQLPQTLSATSEVSEVPVISINDKQVKLPVSMSGGTYYCSSPDGKMLFTVPMGQGDEDGALYVELWVLEENGKKKKLTDVEFGPLLAAEYAPDGKRLALIDSSNSGLGHIYCIELEDGTILDLSAEGMGNSATDIAWDSAGERLYAVNGDQGSGITYYDFTREKGKRTASLKVDGICQGNLEIIDSSLIFATRDEIIYKMDVSGQGQEEIVDAISFRVGNGGRLAVLQVADNPAEGTSLVVVDLASGEQTTILENTSVPEFRWSDDGNTLYFIKKNDKEEDFPYTLCSYDIASGEMMELCDTIVMSFYTTNNANRLMLINYSGTGGKTVTYTLDISQM